MLDVALLAKVVLVGAIVSAALMLLVACAAPRPWRRSACWTWAVGAGVVAASGATDQWPHWPPLEDRARFLTLLVPLTVLVETLAARIQSFGSARARGAALLLRLGLIAAAAPILLYNSVYLADLVRRNSATLSFWEMILLFCGLAALLSLLWVLLGALQRRTSTSAVQRLLVLDALAAAVTVMLSSYYRAGMLGLGLTGAIVGALVAFYVLSSMTTAPIAPLPSSPGGSLGMSVIGIFAVVLMGRFFGALSTGLAACLLLAPLLAWTVELPWLRKLGPRLRGPGRMACVVIPLLVVVMLAQRKFTVASAARSRPSEPNATGHSMDK